MKTVAEYSSLINSHIDTIVHIKCEPRSLFEPIFYALQGGGKRIRPVLTLAVADALGVDVKAVMSAAFAVELFHNFTLLHDDIMDRSETRHGEPSVYCKFGEPAAILSGDAMLTYALSFITDDVKLSTDTRMHMNSSFNHTAIKVYKGQAFDMDFEHRDDVTIDEYMRMIGLKTATLIAGACYLGAISANAEKNVCNSFLEYGDNLGMAFQLQDDLLDTYGNPATFGKPIGGDILNDKKTWLRITACKEAPEAMKDASRLSGEEKVKAVRNIYDQLNLEQRCETLVNDYIDRAVDSLSEVDLATDATEFFKQFAIGMIGRKK